MKSTGNFDVTIFCGLRHGYSPRLHHIEEAEDICQAYCDSVGLCVTLTPTTYIYKDGREPGFAVGLIQYPRFPRPDQDIQDIAFVLAYKLKRALGQERVSVQTPNYMFLLENDDEDRHFGETP